MDPRLVRVVCASCEANYRIAADAVRGAVVDYCCSNCGAVIEVDGTAIELVAPTRPGQDPREKLPRTPEPAVVAPSSSSFRVNAPAWKSDTPAGLVRVRPPRPPIEAFAARRAGLPSSMPPPMSMPAREALATEPVARPPGESPRSLDTSSAERRSSRKTWIALGTLAAAVVVAFIGRSIGAAGSGSTSSAAAPQPVDPQPSPVAARVEPNDFRGITSDPAAVAPPAVAAPAVAAPAVEPRSANVGEPSPELKLEKRRKKAKAVTGASADEPEPVADDTPADPAPPPPFEAPQPPPPEVEFNREAARAALEDAAALAATCREDDTTPGAVRVAVTFVPSGQATVAVVESGVVRGTPVGSCVASKFRTAKVPPFSGTKVTVHKTMMF